MRRRLARPRLALKCDVRHTSPPRGKPCGRVAVLSGIATPPLLSPAPSVAQLEVRPLRASDRDRLADAFELSDAQLDRLADVDHINRDGVVAVDRATGDIVGLARYAACRNARSTAGITVAIACGWQGRGLGTSLTRLLVWRAATTGFTRLTADVAAADAPTQSLLSKLGFAARGASGHRVEFALAL